MLPLAAADTIQSKHEVTTLSHLTTLDVGKNLINHAAGFETLKGEYFQNGDLTAGFSLFRFPSCPCWYKSVGDEVAGLLWLANLNVRGNPASGHVLLELP